MPQVGRPSSRTRIGTSAPISELGSAVLQTGGSALTATGHVAPWSQFVDELEPVPELRWPNSVFTYNEMRRDAQLSALLTSVIWGISQMRFILDPNGARPELVNEISEDLNVPVKGQDANNKKRLKHRFSHAKFVGQALLAAAYGHAYFETVGDIVDGKFRLRKLANRPQTSIAEIAVADDGGLVYIKQWQTSGLAADQNKAIPVDRLVAFIFQQENNSWVGRSMLHDCFREWVIKDKLVRIDATNHERAGGVPYANAPMGATVDEVEDLDAMMRAFRIGDTAGAALPFGAELNIAKGTGSDVNASIQRCDEAMARRFMLMLVNLAQGGQHVGSYGMAEKFADFFITGQRAIVNWYCDTMSEHVIEDIADWNYGEDEELVPRLTWERTSEDNLGIDQLATLVDKKIITMDEELENATRFKYQLPKLTGPRPPDIALETLKLKQTQDAGGAGQGAPSQPKSPAKTKASLADEDYVGPIRTVSEEEPDVRAMAKTAQPVLVTVPNIPIIEAGVEYNLSTGKTTFTPEDLQDMVTAAMEDPAIQLPRLKIGHVDPRYNALPYDGNPAFGKFDNLRLSENGMTVLADACGIPKWLADIMPSAFPSRSVEGNWGVESQSGHNWRFVVTAVSALGVYWPGVMQLEDLPMYYGAERPPDVVIDEEEQLVAASSQPGGDPTKKKLAEAAANLDDIRRAFYNEYVPQNQSEAMMWWVRAVYTDPNELLVEDDSDGQLYMLPFSSDDKGVVNFGESSAVRIDYVPDDRKKAAASHVAAAMGVGREVLASWQSRADSSPETTAGGAMDPKQIRERLGLPEDASDAQVREAILELNRAAEIPVAGEQAPAGTPLVNSEQEGKTGVATGERTEPTEEQKAQALKESGGAGASDEELQRAQAALAAAGIKLPDGFTLMDEDTLKRLTAGAEAGLTIKASQEKKDREALVAAAVGDGRIAGARKAFHLQALELDPEGHAAALAALPKNLVPVDEIGTGNSPDDVAVTEDVAAVTSWTRQIFPETAQRQRLDESIQASGTHPLIMSDAGFGEPNPAAAVTP